MKLIDVDALRADYGMAEDCKECKTAYRSCEYDRIYSKMDFCGWLDDAPTVDAVPVVRCCECRWWHDWNGECYAKEAQGFGHLWNADDYCSYGERKDGGDD